MNSEDFASKVELLKLDGGDGGSGGGCPEPPGNFPGRIYGAMGTTIGERDDGRPYNC